MKIINSSITEENVILTRKNLRDIYIDYKKSQKKDIDKILSFADTKKELFLYKKFDKKNIENLLLVKQLFDINTKKDYDKFYLSNLYKIFVKLILKWDKNEINNVFSKIKTNNIFILPYWRIESNTISKLWTCDLADTINQEIINDRLFDKITKLTFHWRVLWYIKKIWEETLLWLIDIYDDRWNLLLLKWWIYFIEWYNRLIKNDEIKLEENIIDINFLRLCKIEDEILDNFLNEIKNTKI